MNSYIIAEDDNNLSDLIDRALRGEGVVVTRSGKPVVELKLIVTDIDATVKPDLEWLRTGRLTLPDSDTTANNMLNAMRNEC